MPGTNFPNPIIYVLGDVFSEAEFPNLPEREFPAYLFYWHGDKLPKREHIEEHNPVAVISSKDVSNLGFSLDTILSLASTPEEGIELAKRAMDNYPAVLAKYRISLLSGFEKSEFVPHEPIWKELLGKNRMLSFFAGEDSEKYHLAVFGLSLCYSGYSIEDKELVQRPEEGRTLLQPCDTCKSAADYLLTGVFDNSDISKVYMLEWLGKAGFGVKRDDWNLARRQVIAVEQQRLSLLPELARVYGIQHFPAYDALMLKG